MTKKVLSEKFYKEVERLKPRYPTNQAVLIPALHLAQREHGWLSGEVMDEIAGVVDIPPPVVREVASFYAMFNFKPVGKYHMKFCTNISCMLRGGEELMEHALTKLNVKLGETTKDKLFTVAEEECLGACGTAPCVQINDDYHENMTKEHLDRLLSELK